MAPFDDEEPLETYRHHLQMSVLVDTLRDAGRLPNVVIELLSPATEHVGRGDKMRIYARVWRTPEYVLYDPHTHRLEGYALESQSGDYVPITKDARGDLPVTQLGLALGLRPGDQHEEAGPFLRWIDREGLALPTGIERAEVASARAEAAERRIAELEAALRRR